ncbi:MAG: alanine racemase [Hyphomicrobiales bacterium]
MSTPGRSKGADPLRPGDTGLLTIDLDAIAANHAYLARTAAPAKCAGVIKADAYGTGAAQAAARLFREGCDTFFVATLGEAAVVRAAVPGPVIYVLDGLFPGSADTFAGARLRPVLSSLDQIAEWNGFCAANGPLPAAVHIDTGMNRLGLRPDEVDMLAGDASRLASFELALVMSHLACADEPGNPMSERQRKAFAELKGKLPPAPASLANSAGTLLGKPYHFDLVRPGIALYGGKAIEGQPNPMRPVVRLQARIVQVRTARAGETVGYGGAGKITRDSLLATAAIGYADGLFRNLGSAPGKPGLVVHISGHPAPLLGRVSMDLITIDVTELPEGTACAGGVVELLGEKTGVDNMGRAAGTIGYEVLTRLGHRYRRHYLNP